MATSSKLLIAGSLAFTGTIGASFASPLGNTVSADEINPSAPTIHLSQTEVSLDAGGVFNAMEYLESVTDLEDGDDILINDVVVNSDSLDANSAGEYPIEYTVTDSDGNTTTELLYVTVTGEVEAGSEYSAEVQMLNQTLEIYDGYKADGLLHITEKTATPVNMDDFTYNLATLGYTGSTEWLKKGSLDAHASSDLYDVNIFLRTQAVELGVEDARANADVLDETITMYNDYKEDGLLNIQGKVATPDDMDAFTYHLAVLGYSGSTDWLKQGSLSGHASSDLYDVYTFLMSTASDLETEAPDETEEPPFIEDEEDVVEDNTDVPEEDETDTLVDDEEEPVDDNNESETPVDEDESVDVPVDDNNQDGPIEEDETVAPTPDVSDDTDVPVEDETEDVDQTPVDNTVIPPVDNNSDDVINEEDEADVIDTDNNTENVDDEVVDPYAGFYTVGADGEMKPGTYTFTPEESGLNGQLIVLDPDGNEKANVVIGPDGVQEYVVDLNEGDRMGIFGDVDHLQYTAEFDDPNVDYSDNIGTEGSVDKSSAITDQADIVDDRTTDAELDENKATAQNEAADEDDAGPGLHEGIHHVGEGLDLEPGEYLITPTIENGYSDLIIYDKVNNIKESVTFSADELSEFKTTLAEGDTVEILGDDLAFTSASITPGDEANSEDGSGSEAETTDQMLPDTGTSVPTGGVIAGLLGLLGSAFGIRKFFK